jgi:hypothetical protein
MRSPGENAVGQVRGRRHGSSGRDVAPASAGPRSAPPRQPGAESSLFEPGYRVTEDEAAPGDQPGGYVSPYGFVGSGGKGPARGYPPAPGQPPPLYPPGQFAAWNRAHRSASRAERSGANGFSGQPGSDEAGLGGDAAAGDPAGGYDPAYSALAVSDPSADVPSTQSWSARGGADSDARAAEWAAGGPAADDWLADGSPDPADRDPAWPATGSGAGQNGPGPDGPGPNWPGETAGGLATAVAGSRTGDPGPGTSPGSAGTGRPGSGTAAGTQPGRPRGHGAHGTGRRSGGKPRRRRISARWLVTAVVIVALAVGAVTYAAARGAAAHRPSASASQSAAAKSASPRPTASPTPSLGPWGHIAARATDPVPLTLHEVFPPAFTAAAAGYRLTIARMSKKCSAAVIGSRLRRAVRRAGCSQILRASYVSDARKLMGTIGVLNLTSTASAQAAGKTAGRAQFIAQLPSAKGLTSKLGNGTGIEEAVDKGHYLILVWGELTSLRAPRKAAQRVALEGFLSDMISKTANLGLTSRMVNGMASPAP